MNLSVAMKPWVILLLMAILAACSSPGPTLIPTSTPTSSPSITPLPESPTLPPARVTLESPTPAATELPTQTTGQAENTLTNGPFTLTITSPVDQAVVSEPQVDVVGEVSAEAVLTINDDIFLLPAGPFTQTVSLDEGPNAVQIVASDMDGNEVDLVLTVTYQP